MPRNSEIKDNILEVMYEKIIYLELPPNTRINDADIAKQLNVSRTPVREALLILKKEGFVDIFPQSGTFISRMDLDMLREIAFMRHTLETEIIRELLERNIKIGDKVGKCLLLQDYALSSNDKTEYVRHDLEFHKVLFREAGHGNIWNMMWDYYKHVIRYHMIDDLNDSANEHKQIAELIDAGDWENLRRVVDRHHDSFLIRADKLKEKYPDYFVIK